MACYIEALNSLIKFKPPLQDISNFCAFIVVACRKSIFLYNKKTLAVLFLLAKIYSIGTAFSPG